MSIRALMWTLLTCPVSGIMFSAEVSIHNLWGLAVSLQFSKFLFSFCKVFGGEGPHKAQEVRLYLRLTWGQLKNIREMIRLSQLSGSSYPSNFFALGATQCSEWLKSAKKLLFTWSIWFHKFVEHFCFRWLQVLPIQNLSICCEDEYDQSTSRFFL